MNILYYLHNFEINGSNMSVLNYSKYLKKLGCNIYVSSRDNGAMKKHFDEHGINTIIEEVNIDTLKIMDRVIVNSLIRFDANLFLSKEQIPFFQYIHEDWTPEDFQGKVNEKWGWYLPKWEDLLEAFYNSEGLIFPAKYLSEKYPNNLKKYVVFNPINIESLSKININTNIFGSSVDIINIGSINSRKNQEFLVNLCSVLPFNKKQCRFFGQRNIRDNEIKYLEDLKDKVKNIDNCLFEFNDVSFPLNFEFSNNTIFILTSIAEVLPCTIQEMMHVGIPVIAPNRFGIPEVIKHKENGYLFDNYSYENIIEGIDFVVKNRQEIVDKSKVFATNEFNVEKLANKLYNILTLSDKSYV